MGTIYLLCIFIFCISWHASKISRRLYLVSSVNTGFNFLNTVYSDINHTILSSSYFSYDVPSDFKMEFELYYTVITNEGIVSRTPMRTPSKKNQHINAPKFCLAGHVTLTAEDIKKGIISRDLIMGERVVLIKWCLR